MRKLSKINEGLFTATVRRGYTDEKRKEDKIDTNIKDLSPVDVDDSFSVLWANDDLTVDGEYLISFDEVNKLLETLSKFGWRLPTLREISELDDMGWTSYNNGVFHLDGTNGRIVFKAKGLVYTAAKSNKIFDEDLYYGWTSDVYRNNIQVNIFVLDYDSESIIYHSPVNTKEQTSMGTTVQNRADKLCVRLVKDK